MRAAAFTEPGPPDVLRILDVPAPEPGRGEVRVRVKAAGVQPYDAAVRAGWTPAYLSDDDWPRIPGNEFAGVTDDGEEVLGYSTLRSYAEYVVVPEDQVTAKPAAMPWEVAGGFSAGAQTAHIALEELRIGAGDTLLIHGAAGSVGTMAVQLAGLAGATVIGTASEANQDYVRSLGAIPVVYGDGLADRVRDHKPTAVLDGAGGVAFDLSLELVEDRSRILTLVEHDRAEKEGVRLVPFGRSNKRLAELAGLYADGKLSFHVRRTFPLAQAAEAHREIETGHGRGKLVLTLE
ncbi:NADP-dependent oxidoreductase [Actinophytocola sp.]|uniref:NADP-dependent oxidoreductase n=1 Tax=Actinophytocola sp. TaxID=1872138 RepID=UPI002ED6BBBE